MNYIGMIDNCVDESGEYFLHAPEVYCGVYNKYNQNNTQVSA